MTPSLRSVRVIRHRRSKPFPRSVIDEYRRLPMWGFFVPERLADLAGLARVQILSPRQARTAELLSRHTEQLQVSDMHE